MDRQTLFPKVGFMCRMTISPKLGFTAVHTDTTQKLVSWQDRRTLNKSWFHGRTDGHYSKVNWLHARTDGHLSKVGFMAGQTDNIQELASQKSDR